MKLSDLKPCACCGGKIVPIFHVVTIKLAALDQKAARGVLGLTEVLGGLGNPGAFAIAECMSPDTDVAVKVLGEGDEACDREHNKTAVKHIFVCNDCYLTKPMSLAELDEKAQQQMETIANRSA